MVWMDRGGSGLSKHGLKSGIGRLRVEKFGFVMSILVGCDRSIGCFSLIDLNFVNNLTNDNTIKIQL